MLIEVTNLIYFGFIICPATSAPSAEVLLILTDNFSSPFVRWWLAVLHIP